MTYVFAPWHLLVNVIAASPWVPRKVRRMIYRAAGIKLGPANIRPGVFFYGPQVELGDHVFLNRGVWLHSAAPIRIGANVLVGPDVHISGMTHDLGGPERRATGLKLEPVTIGDGCWIGARATILSGVTVGAGCVIAAGAVVTGDCEPNGLYAGVPAVRKRDLVVADPGADVGAGANHRDGEPVGAEALGQRV